MSLRSDVTDEDKVIDGNDKKQNNTTTTTKMGGGLAQWSESGLARRWSRFDPRHGRPLYTWM
jgi:hypothetical protein